ncbi:MAG: hypothetical protein AABY22_36485, partial [Nanoarchaeota archaeon]
MSGVDTVKFPYDGNYHKKRELHDLHGEIQKGIYYSPFWPVVITGWKGDGTDELSSERCLAAVGKKLKVYFETAKSTKKD